jgi:pimeloyl-ACP methyl ester carboxylesterase
MSYVTGSDGVRLYYEEAGSGSPIVFVHEFGGNHWSWEPQMRYFSRRHRCLTFAARGYPPSDIPGEVEAYSQAQAVRDLLAVMDGAGMPQAHVVGLSMGGFAAIHLGLIAPARATSIVAAGAGYGAEKQYEAYFRQVSLDVAAQFESQGSEAFAPTYALGASRVQFKNKDPRGWQEFADRLARHSSTGAANTMRGVQARRSSLYDMEPQLRAMTVPTLVMVGDEDDHCIQPGVFLKRVIPACGLVVLPKTGHTLNLEEPGYFNRFVADFISQVEAGRWTARDARADPMQIMKTS